MPRYDRRKNLLTIKSKIIMENRKHYKVLVYGLDPTTMELEEERYYKDNLEAITKVYNEFGLNKFDILILKEHETNKNEWIKVARIY